MVQEVMVLFSASLLIGLEHPTTKKNRRVQFIETLYRKLLRLLGQNIETKASCVMHDVSCIIVHLQDIFKQVHKEIARYRGKVNEIGICLRFYCCLLHMLADKGQLSTQFSSRFYFGCQEHLCEDVLCGQQFRVIWSKTEEIHALIVFRHVTR